ncbi:hypothetical protein HanIR_Chr14g0709341 [Helianthus annuus]|nr:hypothetical protein HanIR_Chr14g0709341 [Helianthus annuus]
MISHVLWSACNEVLLKQKGCRPVNHSEKAANNLPFLLLVPDLTELILIQIRVSILNEIMNLVVFYEPNLS